MAGTDGKRETCTVTRETWENLKEFPKIQAAKLLYALVAYQMDGEETPIKELPEPVRLYYDIYTMPNLINGRPRRRNGKV